MPEQPPQDTALCNFCGSTLKLLPHAVGARCMVCGERGRTRTWCTQGHFVCDDCRAKDLMQLLEGLLTQSKTTDPVELFMILRRAHEFPMHGPDHHPLVAAAFLVAYHNAYGEPSWEAILDALQSAASDLPGGTCGFWGACSAGLAVGMAYCAILDSSPTDGEKRAAAHRVVAQLLGRFGCLPGARCCRRECLVALQAACELSGEVLPHPLQTTYQVKCEQAADNPECMGAECPFL